jgi:hypothetical protein
MHKERWTDTNGCTDRQTDRHEGYLTIILMLSKIRKVRYKGGSLMTHYFCTIPSLGWYHSPRHLNCKWPIVPSKQLLLEWELAVDTEVLGENTPQFHSVHHNSRMSWPGIEPGPPRWVPSWTVVPH